MADQYEVEVALVYGATGEDFESDARRPYVDRPKVLVLAEGSDSLAAVLAEATSQFQVTNPGDYTDAGRSIEFYRGTPSEMVTPTIPTIQTVTITDSSGLAVWRVELEDASVADLVLAYERKVLHGDPLRPYLLVDPSWRMGGPTPSGWDNFIDIWNALLFVSGSWTLVKSMVRLSQESLDLLERATKRWERSRRAADYTRDLFEDRDADIFDVITTAQAAATYQIADLMAWTGIVDPELAVDVAGWAGYEIDRSSGSLSKSEDEAWVDLTIMFPISNSAVPLSTDAEAAHREVTERLADYLLERGLADDNPDPGLSEGDEE